MKKGKWGTALVAVLACGLVLPVGVASANETGGTDAQASSVQKVPTSSDAVANSCPTSDSSAETFHDDFLGDGVDTSKWTSVGSLGGKYYISEEYASYLSPDDVEVKDGKLKLWLRQDGNKNFTWVGNDSPKNSNGWGWKAPYTGKMPAWNANYPWNDPIPYTAGAVSSNPTDGKGFAQQYGKFSVCQKVPDGNGAWSAFWLLAAQGGWPPEFDVAEYYAYRDRDPNGAIQMGHPWKRNANGDLSWDDSTWIHLSNTSTGAAKDKYVKYSVVLSNDGTPETSYYVNDKLVRRVRGSHNGQSFGRTDKQAEQGFYMVLNNGAQTKRSYLHPYDYPNDSTVPNSYDIDYVSVEALSDVLQPLQKLVNEVHLLNADDYTADSYTKLTNVTSEVAPLLGNPNTSKTDADAAYARVKAAKDALVHSTPVATVAIAGGLAEAKGYLDKNSSSTLSAVIAPDAAAKDWGGKVTWSSSDDNVAAVDAATGVVTGKAVGDATITVTVNGKTATLPVHVGQYLDVAQFKQDNGRDLTEDQYKVPQAPAGKSFAGWFVDPDFVTPYLKTTGRAYAKFVNSELNSGTGALRAQLAGGSSLDTESVSVRVVSPLDSKSYRGVGYDFVVPQADGKSVTVSSTSSRVYAKLRDGDEVKTADTVYPGVGAKWFTAGFLDKLPKPYYGTDIVVRNWWRTLDGTKVYTTHKSGDINGYVLNVEKLSGRQ